MSNKINKAINEQSSRNNLISICLCSFIKLNRRTLTIYIYIQLLNEPNINKIYLVHLCSQTNSFIIV